MGQRAGHTIVVFLVDTQVFFALAVAMFASLILIPTCIYVMFANQLGRGARWTWAVTILVSAGISVWNWISLLADVKRCEDIVLHQPSNVSKADWLALGPICMTSTQLHVALQFVTIAMLISALAWNWQVTRRASEPDRP
jgi:hypothetical protein